MWGVLISSYGMSLSAVFQRADANRKLLQCWQVSHFSRLLDGITFIPYLPQGGSSLSPYKLFPGQLRMLFLSIAKQGIEDTIRGGQRNDPRGEKISAYWLPGAPYYFWSRNQIWSVLLNCLEFGHLFSRDNHPRERERQEEDNRRMHCASFISADAERCMAE